MAIKGLSKLCTPAYVYFVISVIFLLVVFVQNYNNYNVYCLGSYSCPVENIWLIFAVKIIYILFWTWILNLICMAGATMVAWFLLFFPFIIIFIILAMMLAFK